MSPPCPPHDSLSDFVQGRLDPPAFDEVSAHVEDCTVCQRTLSELSNTVDSLEGKVRQAAVEKTAASSTAESRGANSPPAWRDLQAALLKLDLATSAEVEALAKQFDAEHRSDAVEKIIRELVHRRKLTKFQAQVLFQGKAVVLAYGDYIVQDKLGAGGMGQVYLAVHRKMRRQVALKVLPSSALKNPEAVKRFRREVEAAAKLVHPNIIIAHDAGEQCGTWYLVMEYVAGSDLSKLVKERGPLPVAGVVGYLAHAARGLAFAHGRGIVHRDIKPGNLLVDSNGVVKILDMGLARFTVEPGAVATPEQGELTQSGQVMGTVDYMAPEQALDTSKAGPKADVYGLGCSLYRVLVGQPLYAGNTLIEKILAHREQPIPSMRAKRKDVPDALETLFQRMVAKQPEDRPTAAETAAELEAILRRPVGFEIAPDVERPSPKMLSVRKDIPQASPAESKAAGGGRKKPPTKWIVAGTAGFLFACFGTWFIFRDRDGNETARLQVPEGGDVIVQAAAPQPTATAAKPTSPTWLTVPSLPLQPSSGAAVGDSSTRPMPTVAPAKQDSIGARRTLTFKGHRYLLVEDSGSWYDARSKAEGLGGHLVTINSKEERDWIYQNFWLKRAKFGVQDGIHLGGIREHPDRPWNWVTGEEIDMSLWLGAGPSVTDKPTVVLAWTRDQAWEDIGPIIYHRTFYLVEWETLDSSISQSDNVNSVPLQNSSTAAMDSVGGVKTSGGSGDSPSPAIAPFNAAQARAHQDAWAKHLGLQVEYIDPIGTKFMLIPPGRYLMGRDEREQAPRPSEGPEHEVTLTRPFYFSATETTQRLYRQVMQDNPSDFTDGDEASLEKPVERVTSEQADKFCEQRNQAESRTPLGRYVLPTEAQWEFACRAGTTTTYYSGRFLPPDDAHYWDRNGSGPLPVASKRANPFGLFDMCGNVHEICRDGMRVYSAAPLVDPIGPTGAGVRRAIRGGSWGFADLGCRSYARLSLSSDFDKRSDTGFRLAIELSNTTTSTRNTVASPPQSSAPVSSAPSSPNATTTIATATGAEKPAATDATMPVADSRSPIPTSTDLKAAEALLNETYKSEFSAAKTIEDKAALAEKLLLQAAQSGSDAVGRYAILQTVRTLSIELGDTPLIEKAVTAFSKNFVVESDELLASTITEACKRLRPRSKQQHLTEAALRYATNSMQREHFDDAKRYADAAMSAARLTKDAALIKQAADAGKDIGDAKLMFDAASRARTVLVDKPDDPAANLSVGRDLCFRSGRWTQAWSYLAKGSDPVLAELAKRSAIAPVTTEEQTTLGDAWWQAAEKTSALRKAELQLGARFWYEQALPKLQSLAKARVEKRLADAVQNPKQQEVFTPLFNGKDLTGWSFPGGGWGGWTVENGAITCRNDKFNRLYTQRSDFQDFHLRAEVSISDGGNGGVHFRAPPVMKNGGYEAQVNSTANDRNRTGSLYLGPGPALVSIEQTLIPPNTWFTMEVVARGNRIVILLNGRVVTDIVDPNGSFTRGHIALEHHDPATKVLYRKVEIRELPR